MIFVLLTEGLGLYSGGVASKRPSNPSLMKIDQSVQIL
jgi:hypothetical protein